MLMAELNKSLPSFSTNKDKFTLQFAQEKQVQKPLQEVYELFVSSYIFVLDYLEKIGPSEYMADLTRWASEVC